MNPPARLVVLLLSRGLRGDVLFATLCFVWLLRGLLFFLVALGA